MLELLRWFDGCGWRGRDGADALQQPVGEVSSAMLDRRVRAVTKAAEDFDQQSPAERHQLRISVKKLRYTAELLGGLYEAAVVRHFTEPLRRLQDDLGHANDLEVAQQIVAGFAGYGKAGGRIAEAGQRVLDWHRHRLAKREGKTRKHLDRLLVAEPFWRG